MPAHEGADRLAAGEIPEVARVVVGDDLFGALEPRKVRGIDGGTGHDRQLGAVERSQVGGNAFGPEQRGVEERREDRIVGELPRPRLEHGIDDVVLLEQKSVCLGIEPSLHEIDYEGGVFDFVVDGGGAGLEASGERFRHDVSLGECGQSIAGLPPRWCDGHHCVPIA